MASITVVSRYDIASALAYLSRDITQSNKTYVFDQFSNNQAISPDTGSVATTASGVLNDTATNTQLVASGSGTATLSSTLHTANNGQFSSLNMTGHYASNVRTGNIDGYRPAGYAANSVARLDIDPLAEVNLGVRVTGSSATIMGTIVQSNTTGTQSDASVYTNLVAGFTVLMDTDGDGLGDAYASGINGSIIFANNSFSFMFTLVPSTTPYVISLTGQVSDSTTTNAAFASGANSRTIVSAGDVNASITVIPEPGSIAALAVGGFLLHRKSRRP